MALIEAFHPSLCLTIVLLSLQFSPSLPYASFVFGDSLVDAGNNDYLFTLSKADSPPYGIDFAPSGGRPTGRFTNGRTISDIIGQAMGERSFPPPYLAPNTSTNIFSSGINYASGSSGILDETGSLFIGRVPLRQQINYFEETRGLMVRMVGENAAAKFLQTAIFSVTTGSNDILNYVEPSIPFLGKGKVAPSVLQDIMVSNLTLHLKHLHQLGARKFIVVGIGPLGCIPYVRALMLVENGNCSSVTNTLIQGYNMKLRRKINQLNQEMSPGTIFVYANSYQIVTEIIRNYRQYGKGGSPLISTTLACHDKRNQCVVVSSKTFVWELPGFENANDPCCGGSFPPFLCFKGPDAGSSSILCKDRSKYVFWDAYHPTEATNIIIAKRLLDGDASAAYPVNVRRLFKYAT